MMSTKGIRSLQILSALFIAYFGYSSVMSIIDGQWLFLLWDTLFLGLNIWNIFRCNDLIGKIKILNKLEQDMIRDILELELEDQT